MTKKRDPLRDLSTASSSDDDEMEKSGAESEEASSSDDEHPAAVTPSSAVTIAVPGKSTVSAAAKETSDSESGSESETNSDSESNPPPTQGSVKPLTVPAASSAAKLKTKETALPLPAAKSGTKRRSEGTPREFNSKRAKNPTPGDSEEKKIGEESSKKPAFQRLWTEDDEITILQGMIDFKADKGKSPYEDTNAYYDFIKGSISFAVSKNQFMDKLRSLKKKYMNKEKPSFTKPHDQKSYKLCKHIWGSDGLALESAVKSNGKQKAKKLDSNGKQKAVEDDDDVVSLAPDWFENSLLVGAIARFGVDESYVKQRWSLVPVETKRKVEEKVKALQGKELEFLVHKTGFLHEVTSIISESTENMPLEI